MAPLRTTVSVSLALLFGAAFLWLAVRGVDLAEVALLLGRISPGWLCLLLLLPFGDLLIRAARWSVLLRPLTTAPVSMTFQYEAVGLAVNNVVFLRAGELARGVAAARGFGVPLAGVLATIVVERACDLAALLALFSAGVSFIPELVSPRLGFLAAGAAAAGAAALALITVWGGRALSSIPGPWRERYPRGVKVFSDLVRGSLGMRGWSAACKTVALSLGLWAWDGLFLLTTFAAIGLEPVPNFAQALTTLATGAASTALPGVPGGFGNFEAAVKSVLAHFGYPASEALAAGAAHHLVFFAVSTGVGLLCFYRLGFTLSGVNSLVRAGGKEELAARTAKTAG